MKPDKVGDKEIDMPACTVSYKPQELISKISSTVRELLQKKIYGSCSQAQFRSDVMKPLKIEELMDRQVANLSGGEGVTKGCTLSLSRKGNSKLDYSLRSFSQICWYRHSLSIATWNVWTTL